MKKQQIKKLYFIRILNINTKKWKNWASKYLCMNIFMYKTVFDTKHLGERIKCISRRVYV